MKTPENPTIRLLGNTTPVDGYGGAVYQIDPPIVLDDGAVAMYVTTSYGLETILGEGNTFAVFASDERGKVLDFDAIYADREGPDWCLELINAA